MEALLQIQSDQFDPRAILNFLLGLLWQGFSYGRKSFLVYDHDKPRIMFFWFLPGLE
jgi:hypothetical protein